MDKRNTNDETYGCDTINEKSLKFETILKKHGKHVEVSKVKYLYKCLKDNDEIPNCPLQNKKDNEKSKLLRLEGNKIFKTRKNLSKAMELYNQSICWADHATGEELAIGFANRSAVYFVWEQYDICLENVRLALKARCPQRLIAKLSRRSALCMTLLTDMIYEKSDDRKFENDSNHSNYTFDINNKRDTPQLSLKSYSNIPYIIKSLELKTNVGEGRHIVTGTDLVPGQIIAIEDSFVNALTKRYRYRICANCFTDNFMSLIPCKTCTCTMFCSEKCLIQAQIIHEFECPILEYIWEECEEYALPLRLVIKAFTIFNSVDELIEFQNKNENENEKQNEMLKLTTSADDKDRYNQVNTLLTNEDKRTNSDMFLTCCKVAILYHFLIEKTKFSEILQTEIHHDTLISVILQQTQISSINAINCDQLCELDVENFPKHSVVNVYSRGIYPLSSLLNHSCISNTSTVSIGTKILTYVTRPIERNSEVYTSYNRITYQSYSLDYRRDLLFTFYHFNCFCEACTSNYPMYETMKDEDEDEDVFTLKEINLARENNMDLNRDVDNIGTFCSALAWKDMCYPRWTLSRITLKLQRAMTLKFGELSTDIKVSLSKKLPK